MSSAVSEARMPSLPVILSELKPSRSDSTMIWLAETAVAAVGVGIGLTEHDEEVADGAVGDPHLVAVDHPLVAVLLGARRDGRETSDPVSGSEIAAPEIFSPVATA